jgi:hypothetical protein
MLGGEDDYPEVFEYLQKFPSRFSKGVDEYSADEPHTSLVPYSSETVLLKRAAGL